MNLRYITCSDPREFNDIHDIVKLAQISPRVEIAVQAHPSKMSYGMPRNEWFRELLQYVIQDKHNINLAIHVNREWCDEICRTGKIPTELKDFFDLRYRDTNWPVIQRWQLNIPQETAMNTKARRLEKLFKEKENYNFIVQYNGHTDQIVNDLFKRPSARFSVLYDASGGRGISPTKWRAPLFSYVPQGYSGGMSPENVIENLDKISHVAKRPGAHYDKQNNVVCELIDRDDIWIDAEGKLKTDDKFDINRARQYVLNAESWLKRQKQK